MLKSITQLANTKKSVPKCLFSTSQSLCNEEPVVTKRRRSTRLTQQGPSFEDFVSGNASNFSVSDPVLEAKRDMEKIKKLPPWLKVSIPKGAI